MMNETHYTVYMSAKNIKDTAGVAMVHRSLTVSFLQTMGVARVDLLEVFIMFTKLSVTEPSIRIDGSGLSHHSATSLLSTLLLTREVTVPRS